MGNPFASLRDGMALGRQRIGSDIKSATCPSDQAELLGQAKVLARNVVGVQIAGTEDTGFPYEFHNTSCL